MNFFENDRESIFSYIPRMVLSGYNAKYQSNLYQITPAAGLPRGLFVSNKVNQNRLITALFYIGEITRRTWQ